MGLIAVTSRILSLCQSAQPGPKTQTTFYLTHISGVKAAES